MINELTIVIPTYNERENIQAMISCLETALEGINWEVIFVDDDSPDGTSELVRSLAQPDRRIRCIQRLKRKGLSSACIEGILASSTPYIAIMDADRQHDESILPGMLSALKNQSMDIAIGSRYMRGGSTGDLASNRVWISRTALKMSRLVLSQPVSDPMSGFFMMRRAFFNEIMRKLSGRGGFKFLVDILASAANDVKICELPYDMRSRALGKSKLGTGVVLDYLVLLFQKSIERLLRIRFISFAAVGCSGIFVNLFFLWILHNLAAIDFIIAQPAATLAAMTSNYIMNNQFTFRDRKLAGKGFFTGLASYYLACSIGAALNVAVANYFYLKSVTWWIAGLLGAVSGAAWNYVMTSTFTWRSNKLKV